MRHDKIIVLAQALLSRHRDADYTKAENTFDEMLTLARYSRAAAQALLGVVTDSDEEVYEASGTLSGLVSGAQDWEWSMKMAAMLWDAKNSQDLCRCMRCEEDEDDRLEAKTRASRDWGD